jgi:hypothetical protein
MTELSQIREPKFLARKTRLIVGADLGQSVDPTAIAVLEFCKGVIDEGSDYERHTGQSDRLQKKAERWRIVHMERLPLNTRYGDVVQHISRLMASPELSGDTEKNISKGELVIDAGGVGRGVAEMFIEAKLDPVCVTLTGGLVTTFQARKKYNVSKHEAVTALDARINHDKFPLRFSRHLVEADAFKEEIRDFQRNLSAVGRAQFGAREGKHDDMVLAVVLANWWATQAEPKQASWSTYSWG